MPECPEVIILSHFLRNYKNKYIIDININENFINNVKNINILGDIKTNPLKIINISSKGKVLWFEVKNKFNTFYITSHMKLFGIWSNIKNNPLITFILDNKDEIYYNDKIKITSIEIFTKIDFLNKIDKLAIDVLKSEISFNEFNKLFNKIKNKNTLIYNLLIEQNKNKGIVSGLGNYLINEILYHSKISPLRKICDIKLIELKKLYKNIIRITKISYYNNNTKYLTIYKDFIKKHKEDINNNKFKNYYPKIILKNEELIYYVYNNKNDVNVKKIKIRGRTVYYNFKLQN